MARIDHAGNVEDDIRRAAGVAISTVRTKLTANHNIVSGTMATSSLYHRTSSSAFENTMNPTTTTPTIRSIQSPRPRRCHRASTNPAKQPTETSPVGKRLVGFAEHREQVHAGLPDVVARRVGIRVRAVALQ
jgi:hypothetical protein